MGAGASTHESMSNPSPAEGGAPGPSKNKVLISDPADGEGEGEGEEVPSPTLISTPPTRPAPANALGLTAQEVGDVRRVHGLLARDASGHCVRMHIKYFRRQPEHLERFCGREPQREPLHYSPAELSRDSEFTARALLHGLAQLQVLRCSVAGDVSAMASQLASIARAHRGLKLSRASLARYRDVMIGYLEEALPQAMTPSTKQSWRSFLTVLCDGLMDALEQLDQAERHSPRNKIALTSSWIEHELPKGWPLVAQYAGGRAQLSRRRPGNTSSTCNMCNQGVCTCKWDTIHEGKPWQNDSDTFPSLLENDECESVADLSERSQSASETFPVGMSASHLTSD
ncbi:uncharacterized protein LOC113208808 [Frankliniella occidentalis]|uniref:Uncharacterized protein LOC113208808 n=1 Tax=Frankliniella occidentalis TaxID=133901 RepID=A0A6J1SLG5_FRAOC|nr:uncharacterized protein LOC113208808 [Frankliniella occidentalis]